MARQTLTQDQYDPLMDLLKEQLREMREHTKELKRIADALENARLIAEITEAVEGND